MPVCSTATRLSALRPHTESLTLLVEYRTYACVVCQASTAVFTAVVDAWLHAVQTSAEGTDKSLHSTCLVNQSADGSSDGSLSVLGQVCAKLPLLESKHKFSSGKVAVWGIWALAHQADVTSRLLSLANRQLQAIIA